MMKTLNLGCGVANREEEEIGFDIFFDSKPDVCGNAERMPFKDESFHIVKAIHVLEHVRDIVETMNEAWRVLKDGGLMLIAVPMFPHVDALRDPSHVRFFVPASFNYFAEVGRMTGLKHAFKLGNLGWNEDKSEIVCELRKEIANA